MLKFLDPDKSYLEEIINSIADPIFVKDSEHRWVFFNDAFCGFLGRTRQELLGKTDYDFFPADESQIFWEKDELVFNSTAENVNEEKFTNAEGIIHTIVTKKMLYMDTEGHKYIVGIIRDITDQKNTEESLRERVAELEKTNAALSAEIEAFKK